MEYPSFIAKLDSIMATAKKIHFIGIGGISVSSLAFITKQNGLDVTGSDRMRSEMTGRLEDAGIRVIYGHYPESVEGADAVIYTSAVHPDNPELAAALEKGIPTFTRAEYLGWLMLAYRHRIGIAGSHGKSTVTAMISVILMAAGEDPTVLCGAEMKEIGGAFRLGGRGFFVFEACEYCDSFLSFFPTLPVITNIEYDHPDYFKTMDMLRASFLRFAGKSDTALINLDDGESLALSEKYGGNVVSVGGNGRFSVSDVVFEGLGSSFDLLEYGKKLVRITLRVPGMHNVRNALAACAAVISLGISPEYCASALSGFGGVARRFEYLGVNKNGLTVYDDYAHHPTEIDAVVKAAMKTDKNLVVLFQPHTYSRTKALFDDFRRVLSRAETLLICDTYAARENPSDGVTSDVLAASIDGAVYTGSLLQTADFIKSNYGENDLLLILGAGDVVKVGNLVL